jgi:hypothetical protein
MDKPTSEAEISPGFRENHAAPIVYFDLCSAHGILNGAVQIELISRVLVPLANGGVKIEFSTTGRLRCSPAAALALRESINKCLEMLTLPPATQSVATGTMN